MAKPAVFFCYPWDLYDYGADFALDQMVEAGATGVSVGLNSTGVTSLAPMNPFRTVYYGEEGVVFFKPDKGAYTWTTLFPKVSREVDDPEYLLFLTDLIRSRELKFGAWVNYAFNSHLALSHQKSAKVDVFGNSHSAQLSPSDRDFRLYSTGITEDIFEQVKPNELVIQGLSYFRWDYGFRDKEVLLNLSPIQEFLLSLDFSEGTMSMAKKSGLLPEDLRNAVIDLLRESLIQDPSETEMNTVIDAAFVDTLFDGAISRYLSVQEAAASLLFEDVARVAKAAGGKVATVGPFSQIENGLDIFRIKKSIDRLIVKFPDDREELKAMVTQMRKDLRPTIELIARVTPPEFESRISLQSTLALLDEAGIDGYFFYNFGLMRPEHLQWLKELKPYWQG